MKGFPKTSMEAYKSVAPQMRQNHYGRILFAMRLLGLASSMEAIAKRANMDTNQVTRRMKELMIDGCVKQDGIGLTRSGRRCFLYSLTVHGKEQAKPEQSINGEQIFIQQPLFQ